MSGQVVTPRSASRVTGMIRVTPDWDLADLIEQHWIVAWDRRGQAPIRREVLPDPSVNLAVEPSGGLLYGVGSGYSVRELEGHGTVIGTKFRPGAFSGFVPGSVSALSGRVLTLSDAFGRAGAELDSRLAAVTDITAVITEVSRFVRAHRPAPDGRRSLAMEIVEAMRVATPDTPVTEIAASFALSVRTLQRLFTEHVGTTPKQVLQRYRRQSAIDRLSEETDTNIARLAAELGYSDQSHLARDLDATLGRSPSAVRASSNHDLSSDAI